MVADGTIRVLPFSVLAAGGEAFHVMFPLHSRTASPEMVGTLMTRLLDTISEAVAERGDVSSGDVLQAVAMTLAVRAQVVDAPPDAAARVAEQLLADALAAVADARPLAAGQS